MMMPTHRTAAITTLVVVVGLMTASGAAASTILIGDVDGFGFTTPIGFRATTPIPGTTPADTNGDGTLGVGEFLPDLDLNGNVASSSDEFDNREAGEIASLDGAQYTDRSLTPSGASDGLTFTFSFVVPLVGDPDYGLDRTLTFVFGDYDVTPVSLDVDGVILPLTPQTAGEDGLIQFAAATVPFSFLTDGQVRVRLIAPNEPYLAVDYVLLETSGDVTPVPEPASMSLMLLGGVGLFLRSRRRATRCGRG